ncbi:MAG TPA: MBL fold metallo-hydrolase [Kofleriaceae bacterium]|nr:MBL fold metallo-hydrolase [Kofleriaceae bacterium]
MAIRRVHHLNCATMCPRLPAGWLGLAKGSTMIAHCLLLETDRDGLVLVDTGFGLRDVADHKRVPGLFRALMRPALAGPETAHGQITALGLSPNDVQHIVLTHLDLDHAGGIIDFPDATVHVHRSEHRAAMDRVRRTDRRRYMPAQWAHAPKWALYEPTGDTWRGVPSISQLRGVHEDIGLLPMTGHTLGHSAVTVRAGEQWLVHAGDAYFNRASVIPNGKVPGGITFFEKQVESDRPARLASLAALTKLRVEHSDIAMFCAHDPAEYAALVNK